MPVRDDRRLDFRRSRREHQPAQVSAAQSDHDNETKQICHRAPAVDLGITDQASPMLAYSVFCCVSADTDCSSDFTQRSVGVDSAVWSRASM
jgi:hypothetical protein